MKLKYSQFIYLAFLAIAPLYGEEAAITKKEQFKAPRARLDPDFIAKRRELKPYYNHENLVLIASPGRSGSTLLTNAIKKYAAQYKVLKTHLLPPDTRFKGKILFIFSNPDKAAESALHLVLNSNSNGATHFSNVETADLAWFNKIGKNGKNQTEIDNLLAYDALGSTKQLEEWLHGRIQPCEETEAQILAIKYEDLWKPDTIQAIKRFLNLKLFKLPPQRIRGCDSKELSSQEIRFKRIYNNGTDEEPLYQAYDMARILWQQAPSFQFLKIES